MNHARWSFACASCDSPVLIEHILLFRNGDIRLTGICSGCKAPTMLTTSMHELRVSIENITPDEQSDAQFLHELKVRMPDDNTTSH